MGELSSYSQIPSTLSGQGILEGQNSLGIILKILPIPVAQYGIVNITFNIGCKAIITHKWRALSVFPRVNMLMLLYLKLLLLKYLSGHHLCSFSLYMLASLTFHVFFYYWVVGSSSFSIYRF